MSCNWELHPRSISNVIKNVFYLVGREEEGNQVVDWLANCARSNKADRFKEGDVSWILLLLLCSNARGDACSYLS